MYNKIVLLGNLTRDVEIRYSQSGTAIGNCGIAVNRKWKTQTGEQKEEVMFVDITFFGRTAEIANQYLRKGAKVLVDGRLSLDQWTAQDGQKRSKHSVTVENLQMLGGREDNYNSGENTSNMSNQPNNTSYQQQNTTMQQQPQSAMPQPQYGGGSQQQQQQYPPQQQQQSGMGQQEGQQQNSYNSNNNYQQMSQQQSQPQQPMQPNIPTIQIDINEDEIPF
jgi:single-strand DNA-binding protein